MKVGEAVELVDGGVTSPTGFRAAAVACGLKESGKLDLGLLVSGPPCSAAGVFTRNRVAAAPVELDRAVLSANSGAIHGVIANAGTANACTGSRGLEDARAMQEMAAGKLGCRSDQVLVLSTGVIGVPLDREKVAAGLETVGSLLEASGAAEDRRGGEAFARAILTTDTRTKQRAFRLSLPHGEVLLGGVVKGSGMIHPDMATMLAVVTTDAAVEPAVLDEMLRRAVDASFNRISVDGDTSTNDTVLLLANGGSGVEIAAAPARASFQEALDRICVELAQEIVRDGEGASRFVTFHITGARHRNDAIAVGRTLATSPLVKTAIAGGDPNWGRILAAAGRAGVDLDPSRLSLWIAPEAQAPELGSLLRLVAEGRSVGFSEEAAERIFASAEIYARLDLGLGGEEATVWTTDLTAEYVRINADYRT